jgi:phosphate transport system permease protein
MSQSAAESARQDELQRRSIVGGQSRSMRGRYFKDGLARYVVLAGGLGVIGALLLIFVYLVGEVAPLFGGAKVHAEAAYALPAGPDERTVHLAADSLATKGVQVTDAGRVYVYNLADGTPEEMFALPMEGQPVVAFAESSRPKGEFAAQRADGSVVIARLDFEESFESGSRVMQPKLAFPLGEAPLLFTEEPARQLAVRTDDNGVAMAAVDAEGRVTVKRFKVRVSLFGEASLTPGEVVSVPLPFSADRVFIDGRMQWLYVINNDGRMALASLRGELPTVADEVNVGSAVRAAALLGGELSLVVGQADGRVSQWFPSRQPDGATRFVAVRTLDVFGGDRISALGAELYRRTFAVGARDGSAALLHATSAREVWQGPLLDEAIVGLYFNPRSQHLTAIGESGRVRGFRVDNEHPEFSFSALWQRVWYEGYEAPAFVWQSSASVNEFEPKFSISPLAFGTLKAAFYAMLFAIPLAILGAIFTANFMSTAMRQAVKPTIELMEALPTVILGFLAGLWLAPFVETNLLGVFLVFLLLPLSIPLFGLLWLKMPTVIKQRVPPGWEAALLIPVVAAVVWFCFAIALPLEAWLFTGTLQQWMDATWGIGYDQRNALVVGIAMGVAVIPTIYSITEDAVFSVPKQLTLGSLALGATPWQTLVGVVLPTASPGIFSAVMIGVGRAVGETMIVLMATGNTAVMDFSMFEGLRTMSANIAVELPESEVGGTHYRLLFFAGLVLFLFTFAFNTAAEVVRQRLRQKYASI